MTRASILARLKRLETRRADERTYGLIEVPATSDPDEWPYLVQWQISAVNKLSVPCKSCGYPQPLELSECLVCDAPPREPLPRQDAVGRRWGFIEMDSREDESTWLFDTQRHWCEQSAIGSHCPACHYPMAEEQPRCLVCTANNLFEVNDDAGNC